MKPENDRKESDRTQSGTQAPRRRFHIEKLEQRIAPKKGGNKPSNGCLYDSESTGTSGY